MEEAIKYKNVIREYFLEYKNRDQVLRSIFYVILFGASFLPFVFGSAKEGLAMLIVIGSMSFTQKISLVRVMEGVLLFWAGPMLIGYIELKESLFCR